VPVVAIDAETIFRFHDAIPFYSPSLPEYSYRVKFTGQSVADLFRENHLSPETVATHTQWPWSCFQGKIEVTIATGAEASLRSRTVLFLRIVMLHNMAQSMSKKTVFNISTPGRFAHHIYTAGSAIRIGDAPLLESCLNGNPISEAALKTRSDAIRHGRDRRYCQCKGKNRIINRMKKPDV
jgi:hypothetical protein